MEITSLGFPKMFAANKTVTVLSNTATLLNIYLILKTKTKELLGDPEYGTLLVAQLFNNNATALKEIIIDNIYSTLLYYIPQIHLTRNDIKIILDENKLTVTISVYNNKTNTNNLFNIDLMTNET